MFVKHAVDSAFSEETSVISLHGYLDEFMWRERPGDNKFEAVLEEIARQYV